MAREQVGEMFTTDNIQFWNNTKGERQHQITKKEYVRYGYFIGSGAIDSENKAILQDRLKRAGMWWNARLPHRQYSH